MSIVRDTMTALTAAGLSPQWWMTGGGCYCINVETDDLELCITDREDVFVGSDLDSDEDVNGFWATATTKDGDPLGLIDETGTFYFTASHDSPEAVRAEIPALVEAVVSATKRDPRLVAAG